MEYFENKFSVTYISLYNHFSKLSDSCKKGYMGVWAFKWWNTLDKDEFNYVS